MRNWSSPLFGVMLGIILLGWLSLTLYAPGLGFMLAIVGSPLFALFMVLGLLTGAPSTEPSRGKPASRASDGPGTT